MANVLITGVRGFIGSHLYKNLASKHKVVGIDNLSHPSDQNVPFEYVDVRHEKDLKPFFPDCDYVFHLAAQISVDKSIYNAEQTIATNVLGTQNILELARVYKPKVIFASSSEVYGTATEVMTEKHPLDAHSPYAASKVAGDRLCYAYHKTYGTDVVVMRCFNTFGEYQGDDSYGGVIAKFTKLALKNEPLKIYGSGEQERDYMHIKDSLQAYNLGMKLPPGSVVNFGSGKSIKIIDLAHKVIELTGSKSKIEHIEPRAGEVQKLLADITLAESYGFKPETDFWKDLERYVEWAK